MSVPKRTLRWICMVLLWLVIALCLAATVVPRYLDRIYYRGSPSGHFDGERFLNPTGSDTSLPPTGGSRAGFLARMIRPDDRPTWPVSTRVIKDTPPTRVSGGPMRATWVGHATALVQADGVNILTDPIWSDVAGPFGIAGPRRVTEPGVDFDKLPKIDLIVVSHNHYDHLDLTTLKRLWDRDRPMIVTSLGNDTILRTAGIEASGLDWGQRTPLRPGIDVIVNRNHHWSSRWFSDRNRALWSSFVVTLPGGNLFFAGDTGAGDYQWAEQAASYGPIRLAILPIGAFRFQEGQMDTASHIGPGDAIKLWNRMGRPYTMPIHWGTFRLTWEGYWTPPRMLRALQTCTGETSQRFVPHPIGKPFIVPPVTAPPPPVSASQVDRCLRDPSVTVFR